MDGVSIALAAEDFSTNHVPEGWDQTVFTDYRVVYDPTDNPGAGGTTRYYVNGAEYAAITAADNAIPGAGDLFVWGHSGGASTTVASWNHVALSVLPEPATLCLLGLGGLALLRRRR